jgi:hypothetical protein
MVKNCTPLPLFDDIEGVKPQIERALAKVQERPAIALVRVEGSCERGGYGLYALLVDREQHDICGAWRINDPEEVEPCEFATYEMAVLAAVDDLKFAMVRMGLKKPRVFKFNLHPKAS